MVPCRLTGKPYWDVYLKDDPPLWKAHIDALKLFDIDGGFKLYRLPDPLGDEPISETRILEREDERILGPRFFVRRPTSGQNIFGCVMKTKHLRHLLSPKRWGCRKFRSNSIISKMPGAGLTEWNCGES
jgi:hypothetical protein